MTQQDDTTTDNTTIDTIPDHHFTLDMLHVPSMVHSKLPLYIVNKLHKKYTEKLIPISQHNLRAGVSAFAFPQIGINLNLMVLTAKRLNIFGFVSNVRIVKPEGVASENKKINFSFKCTAKPNTISEEIVEFPIQIRYNKIEYSTGAVGKEFEYIIQYHKDPVALHESFSIYHAVHHCLGLSGTLLPGILKGATVES